MNPSSVEFSVENQTVARDGGVIGDYVKAKQSTAYVNVWLNFACVKPIRCSVRCESLLRTVTVSPKLSLSDIVRVALKVQMVFPIFNRTFTRFR